MANREACELYIEQEIDEALKQGKKPYSIGKELAAWIEKLDPCVDRANLPWHLDGSPMNEIIDI